ncbi:alanine transaminase [Hanseniaspora vineae]
MLRTVQQSTLKHANHKLVLTTVYQRLQSSFQPVKKLGLKDINPNVIEAKYAVRGPIPARASELSEQLKKDPGSLPFDKVINSNIGNPQQLGQKPLTFYRQVLSLLQNPELLKSSPQVFAPDALERAQKMLKDIGLSVGSYSSSQGIEGFRKSVAKFISERDGDSEDSKANPQDIFLTGGASSAVGYILQILCKGQTSGVLIPIPQYPLYTASLALNNSHALPYYLKEEEGWSLDPEELEQVIHRAKQKGVVPNCLVVINPGNPTGAVLSVETMQKIVEIAAKYGIVLISDEVYQENVFKGNFVSMRKVLKDLQKESPELYGNVQLASLHSTSKGVSGECGQRGGYMELLGFSDEIRAIFLKLASISLCPVVTGQALVDLMVQPPKKGDPSYELDRKERSTILNALQKRSEKLYETFSKLEGISCQKPEGAMYLFPQIDIPLKAQSEAAEIGLTPDEFYCKELLEHTGICTVPGSGFGQVPGTFHLRTTFLAPGTEWITSWEKFHKEFYDKYRD